MVICQDDYLSGTSIELSRSHAQSMIRIEFHLFEIQGLDSKSWAGLDSKNFLSGRESAFVLEPLARGRASPRRQAGGSGDEV
jgi:hypothetical protein